MSAFDTKRTLRVGSGEGCACAIRLRVSNELLAANGNATNSRALDPGFQSSAITPVANCLRGSGPPQEAQLPQPFRRSSLTAMPFLRLLAVFIEPAIEPIVLLRRDVAPPV